MTEVDRTDALHSLLELIVDCYKEAAASLDAGDEQVTETVMRLFRNEDLRGIADLMEETKLEKDFLLDLQQFVNRWKTRLAKSATQGM